MFMRSDYFEYFQGTDGQWYWRLKSRNHKIIAVGGEGFVTRQNVLRAIKRIPGGHSLPSRQVIE